MSGQPFLFGHICHRLGSRRHYGHENAQKQASCERNLSEIGQLKRGEDVGCPESSTREVVS